uniref:Uncharacterized protein n=1 Tax=Daphnia magna TaxID=35525 RepID=A0A0P6JXC9_9CRUS
MALLMTTAGNVGNETFCIRIVSLRSRFSNRECTTKVSCERAVQQRNEMRDISPVTPNVFLLMNYSVR